MELGTSYLLDSHSFKILNEGPEGVGREHERETMSIY